MSVDSHATASSSSTLTEQVAGPQAGPLPTKRGEIGFNEEECGQTAGPDRSVTSLPERHPADRDATPVTTTAPSNPSSAATPASSPSTVSPSSDSGTSSNTSLKKKRCIFTCRPGKTISFGGILLSTLLLFLLQLALLGSTIAIWVVAVQIIVRKGFRFDGADGNSQGGNPSSTIFIHGLFGMVVMGQLLFLERRVYRMRAERYAKLHPGEILPHFRRGRSSTDTSIAISPWNRPPLPTYAAALAQSGHGTGDVEDHIIAQPPPPAYGNTRGSTMILAGFLRSSLRAQRPISERSEMTQVGVQDRPLSYASKDEEWEVIQDADRAVRLEQTLAALERGRSSRP